MQQNIKQIATTGGYGRIDPGKAAEKA